MIDFQNICKSYGEQTLLDNVSFRINSGDRVGVVGANGAGKTTLFTIITGELEPDSGSVNYPKNLRIGCLRQNLESDALDIALVEYTADALPELREAAAELKAIEHELALNPNSADDRLLRRHGELQSTFEHLGGYRLKSEAEAALSGLGFKVEDFTRPLKSFSGGWRMRAALARVLIARPDALLLDEPSNYLDIPAVEWLCRFLKSYSGTLLLISHDRFLLNRLTNVTLEVNKGAVTRYAGNYDYYRRERANRAAMLEAQYQNQTRKKEQMQRTIDRFRAKSTKAALAKSMQKALDRMEDVVTMDDLTVRGTLRLPDPPAAGAEAARLEKITFGYENSDRLIFKDLDMEISCGDKLAFVGYNGMGKTTLLKLLINRLQPQSGRVVLGHHIVPGYLAQEFADLLIMENTVYDTVKAACAPDFPVNNIPAVLGSFGFPGDNAYKPCSVLSGGEKIRLCFARIFVNPPNLLILDEPTTHLDIAGREILQEVLQNYRGTLCLVSHDIEFVRNVATTIIAMQEFGVKKYFGNYDYFLEKIAAENAANTPAPVKSSEKSDSNAKARRQERAKQRQALSAEKKAAEKRVAELEKKVEKLDARQQELLSKLAEPPGADFGDLMRESAIVQEKLDAATADWEQAMEKLEAIQAANAAIHED
ncbi:MAG: ABC-F family ATP-binding cassette domain-containing protein [Lentisphaerae bacterium]|nr:ABC-F family ATP-binding cassette domain-containing protein [Lentisphaerota bacterium]